MSNIVLLHAMDDVGLADRIAESLGKAVRYVCAVEPGAPIGSFGPQFRIVALWSAAAARDHLGRTYLEIASASDEILSLVCVDGTPAPRLDPSAGLVYRHLETAMRFLRADHEDAAARIASIPAVYLTAPMARRVAGFAATTAMSIAGGALLAGLSPGFVSDAVAAFDDTDTQPAAPVVHVVEAPQMAPPPSGKVMERAQALLNAAREATSSPHVTARFETIQTVSISEHALLAIAGLPPAAPDATPMPLPAEATPIAMHAEPEPVQLSAVLFQEWSWEEVEHAPQPVQVAQVAGELYGFDVPAKGL